MELTAWIGATIATFLGAILASAAGTGGGALYMPAYTIILKDVHRAVPLSKITILGLSVSAFFVNVRRKHPTSSRPLINFEISTLLEPPTLAGAIIGVLLNIVMATWMITSCLVLVLSFTTYQTLRKGLCQFREEKRRILEELDKEMEEDETEEGEEVSGGDTERSEAVELIQTARSRSSQRRRSERHHDAYRPIDEVEPPPNGSSHLLVSGSDDGAHSQSDVGSDMGVTKHGDRTDESLISKAAALNSKEGGDEYVALHDEVVRRESRQLLLLDTLVPWKQILLLSAIWVINASVLFVAGGPTALLCGEWWQIMAVASLLVLHLLFVLFYGFRLKSYRKRRELIGIKEAVVEDGGLAWVDLRAILYYPFLSFLAGLGAGCLGIGGGLIKGPLLIAIGLSPLSAVTTASYMILFTASTNSLQYALLGRLELYPSMWFFTVAFFASVLGLFLVSWLVKRLARQSYVTFILAGTIFLSLVSMLFSGVYNGVHGETRHILTMQDACDHLKAHTIHSFVG